MAKAEKKTKDVVKTVTVQEPDGITLQLSMDEVYALRHIGWYVGGREDGPRGHIDSINEAIDQVFGKDRWDRSWLPGERPVGGVRWDD